MLSAAGSVWSAQDAVALTWAVAVLLLQVTVVHTSAAKDGVLIPALSCGGCCLVGVMCVVQQRKGQR